MFLLKKMVLSKLFLNLYLARSKTIRGNDFDTQPRQIYKVNKWEDIPVHILEVPLKWRKVVTGPG